MYTEYIHYFGSYVNVHTRSNIRLNYTMPYPMGVTNKVIAISAKSISWTPYSWVAIGVIIGAIWETLGN